MNKEICIFIQFGKLYFQSEAGIEHETHESVHFLYFSLARPFTYKTTHKVVFYLYPLLSANWLVRKTITKKLRWRNHINSVLKKRRSLKLILKPNFWSELFRRLEKKYRFIWKEESRIKKWQESNQERKTKKKKKDKKKDIWQ